jgi:hypothetical protein
MSKEKIHFMGLLANVDSSILKVKLEQGFEIKYLSDKDGIDFMSKFENLPLWEVKRKLSTDYNCVNSDEKRLYFISNLLEGKLNRNENGRITNSTQELSELDKKFYQNYLNNIIQLMRLFKDGNIFIPYIIYYIIENDIPQSLMRHFTSRNIPPIPDFSLTDFEVSELERFIERTKFPFTERFLQLAFDNFQLSYNIHNIDSSFFILMSSLEALFNRGQSELTYTISRNIAVLLGENKEESKKIFHEMKKLYDKRSKTIHGRESKIIDMLDLYNLRGYVRESIKEMYKIGKNKNEIFDLLTSCGFGDRQWRK